MDDIKYNNIAIRIGKQLDGKIICPQCYDDGGINKGQMMCCYGDYEDELFCPHCGMTLRLEVTSLG